MKNPVKYLLISVPALLLLYFLIFSPRGFLSGGNTAIQITDTASVNRIEIFGKDTVLLERAEGGYWMLSDNYKVNPVSISNFLYSFMKMQVKGISYKADSSVKASVKIRIYSGRKKHFFRFYPADGNNLIHREGSGKIFSVEISGHTETDLSQVFSDDPDHWKDRMIMDFLPDEISVIEVRHPANPGNDFMIRMENKVPVMYESDGSTRIPPGMLDPEKMNMFTSYFINIFYDKTLKNSDSEWQSAAEIPSHIITVTPVTGNAVKMAVYPLQKEGSTDIFRAGIRMNDQQELLVARYIAIDLILRKKSDFFVVSTKE